MNGSLGPGLAGWWRHAVSVIAIALTGLNIAAVIGGVWNVRFVLFTTALFGFGLSAVVIAEGYCGKIGRFIVASIGILALIVAWILRPTS